MSRLLAERDVSDGVSTCVFGSRARDELTEESDNDWAALVDHDVEAHDPAVALEMQVSDEHLGQDERKPGEQGVCGVPIAVPNLVTNVGRDADTNTNLTRRMLLLLESSELHGAVRDPAISQVRGPYLNQGSRITARRAFSSTTLSANWRTIAVDFEGKSVGGEDPTWALRNAKLRMSRKLVFTGGLCPGPPLHLLERERMHDFLRSWFDATPLDRLATAFLFVGFDEAGAGAVRARAAITDVFEDRSAAPGATRDARRAGARLRSRAAPGIDGSTLKPATYHGTNP